MNRTLQVILSLFFIALYVFGLIAMLAFSFRLGLILWVASTLGSIGFLYFLRVTKKDDAEADKKDQSEDKA